MKTRDTHVLNDYMVKMKMSLVRVWSEGGYLDEVENN